MATCDRREFLTSVAAESRRRPSRRRVGEGAQQGDKPDQRRPRRSRRSRSRPAPRRHTPTGWLLRQLRIQADG